MDKVIKRDPATGIKLQNWERGNADIVPITPNDSTQAVIEMGINAIRLERNGQIAKYPNTLEALQKFQERTEEYFRTIHDHNMGLAEGERGWLPDIESWAVFCNISRVTLYSYSKREGEWGRFIELVKDIIAAVKKDAANNFRTPPVFTIFDLKCNFGYVEKSELVLTSNSKDMTEEQLQDAMDANGLVWNSKTGEYEPAEGMD